MLQCDIRIGNTAFWPTSGLRLWHFGFVSQPHLLTSVRKWVSLCARARMRTWAGNDWAIAEIEWTAMLNSSSSLNHLFVFFSIPSSPPPGPMLSHRHSLTEHTPPLDANTADQTRLGVERIEILTYKLRCPDGGLFEWTCASAHVLPHLTMGGSSNHSSLTRSCVTHTHAYISTKTRIRSWLVIYVQSHFV